MKSLIYALCFLTGCNLGSQKVQEKNRGMIYGSLTVTDSMLVYATWAKKVIVENTKAQKIVFTKNTVNNCYAKPVLIKNKLYFPISDSVFTCVDIATAKTIWSTGLGGRCSDFHVIDKSIIANSKSYGLAGIDLETGKLKFLLPYKYNKNCSLPDLSPYRMSFDKKAFYVCDWQCENVSAFSIADGKSLWHKTIDSSNSNIRYVDGVLFWGRNKFYKGGQIALLDPKNGSVIYKEPVEFEGSFNPIVYSHKVYYYSYDKKLNEFDVEKRKNKVVYVFNDDNDVSGSQMYELNGSLYYSAEAKNSVYKLSLKDFTNKIVRSNVKSIYGVYQGKNKVEFIFL